jgi:hypothetical protein
MEKRLPKLSLKYGYSLASEKNAVGFEADTDFSAPRGSLKSEEILLAESLRPVRTEEAMSRPRDRVLIDSDPGGKEAGYEIIGTGLGSARDDDAAGFDLLKPGKVRLYLPDEIFRSQLDKIIELVFADILERCSQRFLQARKRVG